MKSSRFSVLGILVFGILFGIIFIPTLQSQTPTEYFNCISDYTPTSPPNEQPGGRLLPSNGTIRCILVFVEFPDDNFLVNDPRWPKGQPPQNMDSWIDPTVYPTATPGSITDYFRAMSVGSYNVIGNAYHIIAPFTRNEYIQNNDTTEWQLNQTIIQYLDTQYGGSGIDFAQYDNWKINQEYDHSNQLDGAVDFVWIVWRNIAQDLNLNTTPTSDEWYRKFTQHGEFTSAHTGLGFSNTQSVNVDGGQRIVSFGTTPPLVGAFGCGATLYNYLPGTNQNSETLVRGGSFGGCLHEFGHWLLPYFGCYSSHSGTNSWAMVANGSSQPIMCANAWERHFLGWTTATTIELGASGCTVPQTFSLEDFVNTGQVLRLHFGTDQWKCFYVENHTGQSRWDKKRESWMSFEDGIFVTQHSLVDDRIEEMVLLSSKGRYRWEYKGLWPNPWGAGMLPYFSKQEASRHIGYAENTRVDYLTTTNEHKQGQIFLVQQGTVAVPLNGNFYHAFKMGRSEVFTPWSNPASNGIRIYHSCGTYNNPDPNPIPFSGFPTGIINIPSHGGFKLNSVDANGTYSITVYCNENQAQTAPPGIVQDTKLTLNNNLHPTISWQANEEPDLTGYKIYRAMHYTCDVNNPPTDAMYVHIATTSATATTYIDNTITQCSLPECCGCAWYKVTAVDNQNNESLRSPASRVATWYNPDPYTVLCPSYKQSIDEDTDAITNQDNSTLVINSVRELNSFETLNITLTMFTNSELQIQVVDMLGTVVGRVTTQGKKGENFIELHLASVPTGVYFIRAVTEFSSVTQKILIKR
ncbi:MAG: T9SS type A sorting domain-containing protein [Candidatus Kapaibacterium sp.]|nr:T9SS type A sorting domain-containing protein [Bacteroidota bacterium]